MFDFDIQQLVDERVFHFSVVMLIVVIVMVSLRRS
jgi:hypothetical protein